MKPETLERPATERPPAPARPVKTPHPTRQATDFNAAPPHESAAASNELVDPSTAAAPTGLTPGAARWLPLVVPAFALLMLVCSAAILGMAG